VVLERVCSYIGKPLNGFELLLIGFVRFEQGVSILPARHMET